MSSMAINIHSTTKVTAEAGTGCGAEWVDLEVTSGRGERNNICMFFVEKGKAEKFAAAFNYAAAEQSVRDEMDKMRAERAADTTPRLIPAGHTDAFADLSWLAEIDAEYQADYEDEKDHGWAFEGQS